MSCKYKVMVRIFDMSDVSWEEYDGVEYTDLEEAKNVKAEAMTIYNVDYAYIKEVIQ